MSVMHSYWANLYRGTKSEHAIEPHIAALGYVYRIQHPMFLWGGKYFPDFAIFSIGVIVEVDDDSHNDPEKQKEDAIRTSSLEAKGWRVLRCSNYEAETNPQSVIDRIRDLVERGECKPVSLPPPPDRSRKPKSKKSKSAKVPKKLKPGTAGQPRSHRPHLLSRTLYRYCYERN